MKASNLHDLWASPDNNRLTSKQFSFRLPTHIAAKIAALCEMYPSKTRTQIVADLLTSALDELEQTLPGDFEEVTEEADLHEYHHTVGPLNENLYCLGGLRGRYHNLTNRHYREIEKELGNDAPQDLFHILFLTETELKQGQFSE